MNTEQNSINCSLRGMLLGAPETCLESTERNVLLSRCILKNSSLKRQQAARMLHKIMKANKGKSGRQSNHTGSSKRTHITLLGSCCVGLAMLQKTAILVVSQIGISIYKALFCVPSGYPVRINLLYTNSLGFIRSDTHFATGRR